MTYAEMVKFLVAMIIMMNPLGSLTIFLQLTHRARLAYQRQMALRCGFAIMVIMVASILIGKQLLDLLGITIPSFRVAGGIIVFLMGLSMLQSKDSPVRHTPEDDAAAEERDSIAVVPMALPIIMGPGSISTLVLASNDYPHPYYQALLCFACLILCSIMTSMLYYSNTLTKLVGESVIKVITRIMGMIIMAIAVGMLANGLIGLIPALGVA